LARLRAAAGEPAVAIVLNALIAMPPEIESSLLRFIRGALRHGSGWIGARADPDVATVRQWSRRVRLEIHRFKGLLRFAELASGRWLATCEPDFDIVMPLAFHFRRRLGGQRWLIFDIRRQTAASWNGRQINAETADNRPLQAGEIQAWLGDDSLSADEARCRNLWQVFHQRVSIESRANPRLQRRAMPARYWRHLTEMEPPTT
jgi:probable DNA metabolism protein